MTEYIARTGNILPKLDYANAYIFGMIYSIAKGNRQDQKKN